MTEKLTEDIVRRLTTDFTASDDFKRKSAVWQEHRGQGKGDSVKVTYHVRDDIIQRALKKMDLAS